MVFVRINTRYLLRWIDIKSRLFEIRSFNEILKMELVRLAAELFQSSCSVFLKGIDLVTNMSKAEPGSVP